MNLALITPDHTELPEVVETTLKISGGADVLTTAFNKRGNLLAGGCSDGRVVVWDFDTYGIARELRGHAGPVTSVSWTRSSRRVLSSADDTLIVWEVLGGVELLRVRLDGPVHHAALHPKMRSACLACVSSAGGGAVFAQQLGDSAEGQRREPLMAAAAAEDEGGKPGSAQVVACFDAAGEHVISGSTKGLISIVSWATRQTVASVQVSSGAFKTISLSLDGKSFVTNSADRIIRCFAVSRVLAGEKAAPRELQDVVNRVQWTHAAFSSDSEHVIGLAATSDEMCINIWDMNGHLTAQRTHPKDGGLEIACHPTRPILTCCARSGAVFVWTKQYSENWSAFAPDFKELEENEEYEEKEDEFDVVQVAAGTKAVEEEDEVIDVLTNDVSEVAHVPDADDDEPDLLFLPTKPEPDDDDGADGADAAAAAGGAAGKKRKK